MEIVKGDKNHTGHTTNLNDITLQDFIGLIINQSKLQNIEPIQALNALLNCIKNMQPEELQQKPIHICDIDYTIKNHYTPKKKKERKKNNGKAKHKTNSTNKKHIHQ